MYVLAQIAIFCKRPICEREDIHSCNIPDKDKAFCLQLTLKLPEILMASGACTTVTGLLCTGLNYAFTHLWASDSSGQLTVWNVPSVGLDFTPAHTVKAHAKAINAMTNTYRHIITVADDGVVKFFDVVNFAKIRSVNVLEWCLYRGLLLDHRPDIARRLKCVHLVENHAEGGTMVVGTSYGDVIMFSLGTSV